MLVRASYIYLGHFPLILTGVLVTSLVTFCLQQGNMMIIPIGTIIDNKLQFAYNIITPLLSMPVVVELDTMLIAITTGVETFRVIERMVKGLNVLMNAKVTILLYICVI